MEKIFVRKAKEEDLPMVNKLLYQVEDIHRIGRPDLFKVGEKKYTDQQLLEIFSDEKTPVFVADSPDGVLGYVFCIVQQTKGAKAMYDHTTLYIDDLCVDEKSRGMHVGKSLYEYVLDFAKKSGCYNVTLNVWSLNKSAMAFYEKCGLVPQKVCMEKIL